MWICLQLTDLELAGEFGDISAIDGEDAGDLSDA
jgi:hypothetical protein